MRDAAIIRVTLRELAPLFFGTLAVGLLVAMWSLDGKRPITEATASTWPLTVIPCAALWGGLSVGGGGRMSLVHWLARPVSRLRVLAWRWGLLLAGLALVAVPLWWIGLHEYGRGPGLWSIAVATLAASAFGAQGAALCDREPAALAAALALGVPLLLPTQLQLEATQLSWTRVHATLGWAWLVPLVVGFAVLAAPVAWAWARSLPVRGSDASLRTTIISLVGSLLVVACVVTPMFRFVAAPHRGELLAVVAKADEGVVVITGTRGESGVREVADGLVLIDAHGERRTIWDRRAQAPDATVWRVYAPEFTEANPTAEGIRMALVEGAELSADSPMYEIEVPLAIAGAPRNKAALAALARTRFGPDFAAAYGPPDGPWVTLLGNALDFRDASMNDYHSPDWRALASSEIAYGVGRNLAIAEGRVWAVLHDGTLWSASVPWEVEP